MRYLLSDTHFDHRNIIDHCDRPFESVEAMNRALVENWNDTVDPDDSVVFLGDLTVVEGFDVFLDWMEQLHGTVEFVLGDHDETVLTTLEDVRIHEQFRFNYRGIPFYCVHDPADAPQNWTGWTVHGHHHNNWPDQFPFVDPETRRVNVSVELVRYTPLPLPRLVEEIRRFERQQTLSGGR